MFPMSTLKPHYACDLYARKSVSKVTDLEHKPCGSRTVDIGSFMLTQPVSYRTLILHVSCYLVFTKVEMVWFQGVVLLCFNLRTRFLMTNCSARGAGRRDLLLCLFCTNFVLFLV